MNQRIVYEMTPETLKEAIKQAQSEVLADVLLSRYEGRKIKTSSAAQVLGISLESIYKYVDAGWLLPEEREGRNYSFDLRYLLEFNIKGIKGKKIR